MFKTRGDARLLLLLLCLLLLLPMWIAKGVQWLLAEGGSVVGLERKG
jgi:hypothetical protein